MAHRSHNPLRRRLLKFITFLALILAVSLWFLSKGNPSRSLYVSQILMTIAFPFQKAVSVTTDKAQHIFDNYIDLINTKKENEALQKMVSRLQNQAVRLKELERENKRLRELLNFKEEIKPPLLPAEVIAKSPSPWIDTFIVDKGTKKGIQKGMPVISEKGIVGYILKTSRYVSTVLVLTHYNCRVDAIIQRTRAHGVVGGLLEGHCRLFNVLRTEHIMVGDRVVTSGFGNRFPRGLLIGVVSKVIKKPYGLFQEAEITPSVDFSKLEEVYILLRRQSSLALNGLRHE